MDPYHYQTASSLHHSQQQPLTSISNLANHASHAYNSDSPGPANTLPPLNGHNNSSTYQPAAVYKNGHSGHQTPRVPHTPDTPSSAEQPQPQQHSLPHLAPQQPHMNVAEPHVGAYAPTASYSYQENSPTIYHSPGQQQNGFSMAGMPQYSQGPLPHIGPAVQGTYDRQSEQASYSYGPTSQAENQSRQSDPRPMPVVGSQGRRGILPSISGRAPPVGSAPDGSMRGVTQPTKNSENKYQCQYCTKTYLHLKHLKRHHLRHTGERPYQCSLCHETFCRSDILKRHFSKCAIRRGNPSGANHLTHAQAHLQKPPRSAPNSANGASAPPAISGLSISTSQPPSSYTAPWSAATARSSASTSLDQNQFPPSLGDSTRTSRSSSFIAADGNSDEERKRYSAGSNLAPVNGHLETHTNGVNGVSGVDRPMSYPMAADRPAAPGIRENQPNGWLGHQPIAASNGTLPSMQFMRPSGNGWPQYHASPNNDGPAHWSNCFTPGAQDTIIYNAQH